MPFCIQCGAENPSTARFCDQCGAQLEKNVRQPAPINPDVGSVVLAGPTTCPQCNMAIIPGEAFCDNCGAPLTIVPQPALNTSQSHGIQPQPIYPPPQPVGESPPPIKPSPSINGPVQPQPTPPIPSKPLRTMLSPARLIVQSSGTMLPLPTTSQAFIGRADPVSNFYPDIDLAPLDAHQYGVGRRHARLQIQDNAVVIEDLDSTNGTFLNKQRLPPRVPTILNDGDELRLGSLILRVQL